MTQDGSSALYTALAYHRAWTSHDLDQAMTYIDPTIVCDAPGGPVIGIDDFRDFIGPIARNLTRVELIAANGDTRTAVLIYDTETVHVEHVPIAEYLTIRQRRITRMRMIFRPVDRCRP